MNKYILLAALFPVLVLSLCPADKKPEKKSDYRDAPITSSAMDSLEKSAPGVERGDPGIPAHDPGAPGKKAAKVSKPLKWVLIPGGSFIMGSDSGDSDARPAHKVEVKPFLMARTEVTVEQYAECVARGVCSKPETGGFCNWDISGRELYPVNCVSWEQAVEFAHFKGGRLPTEAEWEFAATGGGGTAPYPWGEEAAGCGRAVMFGDGGYGCGSGGPLPVCSRPSGNTKQGLCDMAGNLWEWTQDWYKPTYEGVPADGSAFEAYGNERSMRGGAFNSRVSDRLRVIARCSTEPVAWYGGLVGFRPVRALVPRR